MTEMSPLGCVDDIHHTKHGSSGALVPSTVCKIVEPETGETLPSGEPGEVYMGGPQVGG